MRGVGRGAEERGERREGRREEVVRPSPIISHQSIIPNPKSLTPNPAFPSPDAWLFVLAGGVAGFLLSMPVGMLSAAPPGVMPVLIGLPLAAAAIGLMLGWIREGRLPGSLPAVGVAVLLVDLLTTGGIGFPSMACTLWLLLALGLQGDEPQLLHPSAAWMALLAAIALVVACYGTAYSPVLGCQAQMRLAEREPARAAEHLEAAAAADPLAAEPWRQLAAVEFEAWWRQPSEDGFHRFRQANDHALKLAPNSASTWLNAGDWYSRAYSKTDRDGKRIVADAMKDAVSAYDRAVQLYPNSAVNRARLAEACEAAGDRAAFRREATTALELDGITPPSREETARRITPAAYAATRPNALTRRSSVAS